MSFLFLPLSKGMLQLGHVVPPVSLSNNCRIAAKSGTRNDNGVIIIVITLSADCLVCDNELAPLAW